MKNNFLNYKQACLLKDLGFNEPCFAYYNSTEIINYEFEKRNSNCNKLDMYGKFCAAPLYQQAFEFFRKSYSLFYYVISIDPARTDVYWEGTIYGNTKNKRDIKTNICNTYKEAEFQCLNKMIEVVKRESIFNIMKDKIKKLFLTAMREKDVDSKRALSALKTKITEFEKTEGNRSATDNDILKIITKGIKERHNSAKIYSQNSRLELADKEIKEIAVLEKLLPPKMSFEVVKNKLVELISTIPENLPRQVKIGKTIGLFNKQYPGECEISMLKEILNEITES